MDMLLGYTNRGGLAKAATGKGRIGREEEIVGSYILRGREKVHLMPRGFCRRTARFVVAEREEAGGNG